MAGADEDILLFHALHEEYERVVRDPTQLAGRADWTQLLAPTELQSKTAEGRSLNTDLHDLRLHIGRPDDSIDKLIGGFEPWGQSELLDESQNADVLRMFAPEWTRQTGPVVPSLTLREHHALSPDSHMPLAPQASAKKDGAQ